MRVLLCDRCTGAAKAAAFLIDNLQDPETAYSEEPYHAPLQRAYGTKLTMYPWIEQDKKRIKSIQIGMRGATNHDVDITVNAGELLVKHGRK